MLGSVYRNKDDWYIFTSKSDIEYFCESFNKNKNWTCIYTLWESNKIVSSMVDIELMVIKLQKSDLKENYR